ncbi:hypothetical protein QCB44_08510 [Thiomicrorhabdus sp. zzn3]|uniref:DUF4870 family protein n=1 Tax=Thiomicrorhabdus sp. zzn3 TaxID=3039775 RepID=UPI002436A97C|nr:hypothetical protein [Thiomicrorhabdus sp. zzn3]MDG6778744.1 hypothetical protein [Thiomicrorhabdus sp. zzn3]
MTNSEPTSPNSPSVSTNIPMVIYVLYLLNLAVPFAALVGIIMAYVNRSDAEAFLPSHYRFQIRTFWIGLLFGFIGTVLTVIIIGWFMLLLTVIWLIIRCVIGIRYLNKQQEIPHPSSWLFGN